MALQIQPLHGNRATIILFTSKNYCFYKAEYKDCEGKLKMVALVTQTFLKTIDYIIYRLGEVINPACMCEGCVLLSL